MLVAVRTSILGAAFIALAPQLARANNAGGPNDAPDEVAELHCTEHERLVMWATGDLNGDGRQDLATIVERSPSTPEEKDDDTYAPPRVLRLYVRTKPGHLALSGEFPRSVRPSKCSSRFADLLQTLNIEPDGSVGVERLDDETFEPSVFNDYFHRRGKRWFYIGGRTRTAYCQSAKCGEFNGSDDSKLDLQRRRCTNSGRVTVLAQRFKPVPLETYDADNPLYVFDGCDVRANTALRKVRAKK